MKDNEQIPKGKYFGPFLARFLKKHNIDFLEAALALEMSNYTLERLIKSASFPTEKAFAEFAIFFTIIEGKGFKAYKKLSRKDKDNLIAKIIAGGGSAISIGGIVALISACGYVGLSAAGITSGLAAIGAVIGGGMLAGIVVVATAPILVGGAIYCMLRKKKNPDFLTKHKDHIDPIWEKSEDL